MKKTTKLPLLKDAFGEVKLLSCGHPEDKREYVLWYGFKTSQAQQMLARNPDEYLIALQSYIYGNIWEKSAAEILSDKNLLPRPTPEDDFAAGQALKGWLGASLFGDRDNEKDYGCRQSFWMCYSADRSEPVSEAQQLEWLRQGDKAKIMAYPYVWEGRAEIEFLTSAPEDAVYRYLHYNRLPDDEAQCALVQRDIRNNSNGLLWYYFHSCKACPEAQRLIQSYDSALWREMILVNYGWDYKYEKKFSNLANWRSKLSDSWPLLAHCPIEEIPTALDKIE